MSLWLPNASFSGMFLHAETGEKLYLPHLRTPARPDRHPRGGPRAEIFGNLRGFRWRNFPRDPAESAESPGRPAGSVRKGENLYQCPHGGEADQEVLQDRRGLQEATETGHPEPGTQHPCPRQDPENLPDHRRPGRNRPDPGGAPLRGDPVPHPRPPGILLI